MNKRVLDGVIEHILGDKSVGVEAWVRGVHVLTPSNDPRCGGDAVIDEGRVLISILLNGSLAERYGGRMILDGKWGIQPVLRFAPSKEKVKAYLMMPILATEKEDDEGAPIVESYETIATADISLADEMVNRRFVYCENIVKTRRLFAADVKAIFDFFYKESQEWIKSHNE